jgi:hypothetical protein
MSAEPIVPSVERFAVPDTTPEEVLAAAVAALTEAGPQDYWHGSRVARKAVRATGWEPGHDFALGRKLTLPIHSAAGWFWLTLDLGELPPVQGPERPPEIG